jgi:hypothetical protein
MKTHYFHGTLEYYEHFVPKGKYVSNSERIALYYACRKKKRPDQEKCYVYDLLVDPAEDLEEAKDACGTMDRKLVRDTPFVKRIPVTDEVITNVKKMSKKIADDLRD